MADLVTGKSWNATNYPASNDGRFIDRAAISRDGKLVAFWYHANSRSQLRMIGSDGKNERTLYSPDPDSNEWGVPQDWSPDGSQILMYVMRPSRTNPNEGTDSFVSIPAAGGSPRILRSAHYMGRQRPKLQFSPDGRYVAYDYSSERGQTDIFVMPASGGQATTIAGHPAREEFVSWAPDGSVLFLSDRTGSLALYRARIKDGKQQGEPEVLRRGMSDRMFSMGVSLAGALYFWNEPVRSDAYVVSMDFETGKIVSPPARVTKRFTDSTSTASWSADGAKVAFVKHRQDGGPPTVLIGQGDGEEREVQPDVRLDLRSMVRWHADGRSLLALGTKGDKTGLFRINADSGAASLVMEGPHGNSGGQAGEIFDWSPDGRWVLLQGPLNGKTIIRKDSTSGEEEVIETEGASRFYRIAPDGKKIAFTGRSPDALGYLGVIAIDSGPVKKVFLHKWGEAAFVSLPTAWTPDGRYLVGRLRIPGGPNTPSSSELWIVPADGGQPRKAELSSAETLDDLNVSPDGKQLAYTIRSSSDEFWVLENFLPPVK